MIKKYFIILYKFMQKVTDRRLDFGGMEHVKAPLAAIFVQILIKKYTTKPSTMWNLLGTLFLCRIEISK